jgi:hypothetical protein
MKARRYKPFVIWISTAHLLDKALSQECYNQFTQYFMGIEGV